MGYADGYYYGQGRIICDTSTFSVGDTIRVRSMTDSSKVWNQQVATVGTALVFTVPCYDYYKICTVQTINDTPTEIGGVYKTVDYGQTILAKALAKNTLIGAKAIVNAHNENIYDVGDEIIVDIDNEEYPFVVAHIRRYNDHDIIFVSKYIIDHSIWATNGNTLYTDSTLKTNVDKIGDFMRQEDYDCITPMNKSAHYHNASSNYVNYQAKIWLPTTRELFGNYPNGSYVGNPTYMSYQFDYFITAGNRVGYTKQGNAEKWWTSDGAPSSNGRYSYGVNTSGNYSEEEINNNYGIRPCFILVADS